MTTYDRQFDITYFVVCLHATVYPYSLRRNQRNNELETKLMI